MIFENVRFTTVKPENLKDLGDVDIGFGARKMI